VGESGEQFNPEEEEVLQRLMREIECVLFLSASPVPFRELRDGLMCHESDLKEALDRLLDQYKRLNYGIYVKEVAGGYRFVTRSAFQEAVKRFFSIQDRRKLSRAALETLAVIAYRQPVTKADVEQTRGVGVSGVLNTLIERGMVRIAGRSDAPGRPFLYATTREFLEFFGIKDLQEMPRLEGVDGAPEIVPPEPPTDQLDLGFNERSAQLRDIPPKASEEKDEDASHGGDSLIDEEMIEVLPILPQDPDSEEEYS
jgi:segregation and condensation protein B